MRADEFDKTINEAAPMSGLSKLGQTIRSKLPGLGAEVATGKLQLGQLSNQIAKEYYRYLGTKPKQNQQPTAQNLLKFLQQKHYPLHSAKEVLKTVIAEITTINEKTPVVKPSQQMAQIQQTAAKSQPVSSATPTSATTQDNVKNKILTQNQVNSAIVAAASDKINKDGLANKTPTHPENEPSKVNSYLTKNVSSSTTAPRITQSFAAGLQGRQMPSGSGSTLAQIDLSDYRSVNTLIQQMDNFAKQGGKLNPKVKTTLQQIINKL